MKAMSEIENGGISVKVNFEHFVMHDRNIKLGVFRVDLVARFSLQIETNNMVGCKSSSRNPETPNPCRAA